MNIDVAEQHIYLLTDQITADSALNTAKDKKISAFGMFNQVASFLSKPKDEDYELKYSEHRYEPFWHVVVKSHYTYDRNCRYSVKASGSEVKKITYRDADYPVENDQFFLPVVEHCQQDEQEEVFVDGITGKNRPELKKYLTMNIDTIDNIDSATVPKGAILIPPQARVSGIMRDSLAKIIKGIDADKILEEKIEVEHIDLYYRPVYAYQYLWKTKGKETIIEVDGLNGESSIGNRIFKEYIDSALDKEFIWNVSKELVSTFVPGGEIAIKIAQHYVDIKKKHVSSSK